MAEPTESTLPATEGPGYMRVHGPVIGECTETSAVIWYRDARSSPEPPLLTWSTESGDTGKVPVSIDDHSDYTSKTKLSGLKPNTEYTILIGDCVGRFKTPGARAVSFVFGSCIGGQGYGRNAPGHPDGEGFPIFRAMAALKPDFCQINGDFIYADNKIDAESTMFYNKGCRYLTPKGTNVLPVATDLDSFRARYRYNLEDPVLASFLANCPVFNTWDDHEIFDDFGQAKLRAQGQHQLYEDGERAFHEFWPLSGPPEEPRRIYRSTTWGPNAELFILDTRTYRAIHEDHDQNPETTPFMKHMIGPTQLQWLVEGLSASTATWKFIATSVPLSYPTGWPRPEDTGFDGWADGNNCSITGPEEEVQTMFQRIRDDDITGVIFLSGDVHFPFSISYDPFLQGKPLVYEFGATPFQALCLPPPERGPDTSFHPTVLFAEGEFGGNLFNFGHVIINDDGQLTFHIRNAKGESVYELTLPNPRS